MAVMSVITLIFNIYIPPQTPAFEKGGACGKALPCLLRSGDNGDSGDDGEIPKLPKLPKLPIFPKFPIFPIFPRITHSTHSPHSRRLEPHRGSTTAPPPRLNHRGSKKTKKPAQQMLSGLSIA